MQNSVVLPSTICRLVQMHAQEKEVDFNEAVIDLLTQALDFNVYAKTARRKNPVVVAWGMLVFADHFQWPTKLGITARELYAALRVGAWSDLSEEARHTINQTLVQETSNMDNLWSLKCLRVKGQSSRFGWNEEEISR